MAIKKKKISDFPLLEQSLRGFFTIGYKESKDGDQTTAQSYKADLGFVEEAAQGARTATEETRAAIARAEEAAEAADGAAQSARSAAGTAEAAAENADLQAAYALAQGGYAHEQGATIDAKIGGKLDRTEVGKASGAASLDASGNVPLAQLGALASAVEPAEGVASGDRLLIAGATPEGPVQSITAEQFTASIPYVGENIVPCSPGFWEAGGLNLNGDYGDSPAYIRTADYWPAAPGKYIASMSENWVHSLILAYNSEKTFLNGITIKSTTWINQVIELPAGTAYIKLSGRKDPLGTASADDILSVRIKIEPGTQATPWCPNTKDITLKDTIPYVGENLLRRNSMTLVNSDQEGMIRFSDTGFTVFGSASNNAILDFGKIIPGNGVYTLRFDARVNTVSWGNHILRYGDRALAPGFTIHKEQFNETVLSFEITDYAADKTLQLGGLSGQAYTFDKVKFEAGTKATPWSLNMADIARIVDYSLLSEQIVPGEFFPGRDGSKKQVYTRTYVVSAQLGDLRVAVVPIDFSWIDTFKSVGGTILFKDNVEAIGSMDSYEGYVVSSFRALKAGFSAYVGHSNIPIGTVVNMVVTIKYTKL